MIAIYYTILINFWCSPRCQKKRNERKWKKCGRIHVWALKTQKLRRSWSQVACFATSATFGLRSGKILDPNLSIVHSKWQIKLTSWLLNCWILTILTHSYIPSFFPLYWCRIAWCCVGDSLCGAGYDTANLDDRTGAAVIFRTSLFLW